MGGIGIEVLFRQAHFRQVFAGRAVGQDGVGWRQVISGDVVRQHGQRPRAFPIRRAANVGALRSPCVKRADGGTAVGLEREHRFIDLAEMFGLHAGSDHRIDFGVAGPDVLERDRLSIGIGAEHILFDVEPHRARNRVGNHQRR